MCEGNVVPVIFIENESRWGLVFHITSPNDSSALSFGSKISWVVLPRLSSVEAHIVGTSDSFTKAVFPLLLSTTWFVCLWTSPTVYKYRESFHYSSWKSNVAIEPSYADSAQQVHPNYFSFLFVRQHCLYSDCPNSYFSAIGVAYFQVLMSYGRQWSFRPSRWCSISCWLQLLGRCSKRRCSCFWCHLPTLLLARAFNTDIVAVK